MSLRIVLFSTSIQIGYKEIEDDLLMTEEGRDKFIESIKNQILAKTEGIIPGVYISGRVK